MVRNEPRIIEIKDSTEKQADDLMIGGLTRFTTIDFPGCLSAVVFVRGCPWACVYCQNKELQKRKFDPEDERVDWSYVRYFLDKRRGLIDGLVFSGGEPCVDPALINAAREAKELSYKVGLHTGGMYPDRLEQLLPLLDWVGLDVKAPLSDQEAYEKVVGRKGSTEKVRRSLELLLKAGIPIEVRTTAHPDYLNDESIIQLAHELSAAGVKTYALQIYRQPRDFPAEDLLERVGSDYPSAQTLKVLEGLFSQFILRRT